MILHVYRSPIYDKLDDDSLWKPSTPWSWEWTTDGSGWYTVNEPQGILVTIPDAERPTDMGYPNCQRIADVVGEEVLGA